MLICFYLLKIFNLQIKIIKFCVQTQSDQSKKTSVDARVVTRQTEKRIGEKNKIAEKIGVVAETKVLSSVELMKNHLRQSTEIIVQYG
jgi:hypothetical protein